MRYLRSFGPSNVFETGRVTQKVFEVETYRNRDGYNPAFLGGDAELPLPGAGRWAEDLIGLEAGALGAGADPAELKYTHFSVMMSASRAMPLFSACNIDGKLSDRDIERTDLWRRDSRIPLHFQNLKVSYGNESQGLFSRGHMTRREDPNWGDKETATRADADTFHITNVCPQRQGFNAGIWLDLENYVLDSTDRNDFKATVITGPIFGDQDPIYYDIKIPTEFYKIIAYRDPRTGEVATLGYKRSQLTYLPKPAGASFVFGDFEDTQVPIKALAEETGLVLDDYIDRDVMLGAGSNLAVRLSSVADVYLRR